MESRPDPIQDPDCAPSAIAAPEDDGREHADFLHLLDATAAEREAWLAEAAARCESYARRLRTLLAEVEGDLGRIEEERRDPDLGRRIGRWRLIRSLGRGATARVSLGVDEGVAEGHPGCRAAIKLFDRVDFGSGFRKRLEREIEALRRIDHPGVVRFLADGTDDATGRPWVAMEFVDGAMPIVEWASVRAATVDERAELVRQLREALAAAHAAGVVHRDLSPGNVLVDRDGCVKIVDFGIAAVVRESIGRAGSVSASGLLLGGTPATMAPEQVEPSLGPVGPWTDEYAAAIIAFRLFAGRFPYDTSGSLASVAQAVVHVPAPEIRSLEPGTPAGLAAWIDASLVKRVDARRAAMGMPTLGQRRNGGSGSRRVRTVAVVAAFFLAAIAAWAFDSVRARGPAPPGPKIEEQESEMNISKAMSGAAAAGALASGVAAVDRDVPGEYPTIQAAIDAAVNGDTIRLAAGEFVESAVIVGKSLAIRGAGMDQTTWRSAAGARCLHVPAPQPAVTVEVSDLSVTGHGMPYSAAAVDIESAGANRVSRVRFHDNGGWATLEVFGVGATVEHCIFERNAHAVSVAHAPQSRVTACQFVQNGPGAQSGWSDMIFFEVSTVVEDCLFWGSSASMAPITNWHTVVFDSCTFVDLSGGYASVSEGVPGSGTQYRDNRFCGCPVPRFAQQYIDLGGNVFSMACGDCDEDGIPDAVEIYRGEPDADADGDGVPDECNCPGDVDSSGAVNAVDIAVILGVWGTSGGKYPGADVDGSGMVDAVDLGAVLAGWGPCP